MGRAKEVLHEVLQLDPVEQDELLEEVWALRTGGKLGAEWEAEIESRIDDLDAGRVETVDGAELMSRLRQRYRVDR